MGNKELVSHEMVILLSKQKYDLSRKFIELMLGNIPEDKYDSIIVFKFINNVIKQLNRIVDGSDLDDIREKERNNGFK